MRHHDAKFAASELYDTMSQSWKGEFMDPFTEAVDVLPPVKITRLWPPIRAEPGKDSGRQRQIINETAK